MNVALTALDGRECAYPDCRLKWQHRMPRVLYLNDSRSLTINFTATVGDSNSKDYTLTDLRLEKEAGRYYLNNLQINLQKRA